MGKEAFLFGGMSDMLVPLAVPSEWRLACQPERVRNDLTHRLIAFATARKVMMIPSEEGGSL
jgi:hypothetical protein